MQHLVKPGLRTATGQFSKALQEAASGSRAKVAERNMAAKVLKSTLGNIARHLELQLKGEYTLALEAGFNVNTYAPRSNDVQLQTANFAKQCKNAGNTVLQFRTAASSPVCITG